MTTLHAVPEPPMLGPDDHLSDLRLDRFRLAELTATEHAAVEDHLASCDLCRARDTDLRAAEAAFVADPALPLAARQAHATAQRASASARRLRWAGGVGVAVAIAAGVVLALGGPPSTKDDGLRTKGADTFEVFVKPAAGGAVTPVSPGDTLFAEDAIRFRVRPHTPAFVGVIGIDGAGTISPYHPEAGPLPHLADGIDATLDGSIILDATQGDERLVAVFCDEPVSIDAIITSGTAALTAAHGQPAAVERLDIPCRQRSLVFAKGTGQ